MRRVLDDWYAQHIVVSQVSLLAKTSAKCLDLFDVVDLEHICIARSSLKEECYKDSPLRVRMDATSRIALLEGCEEERRALRWLEGRW